MTKDLFIGTWCDSLGEESGETKPELTEGRIMKALKILAVLAIFVSVVSIRRGVTHLNQTDSYSRIFISTVMSYLQVEPEHDKMKILREQGMLAALKRDLSEKALGVICGTEHDPQLECRSKRNGKEVTLQTDIQASTNPHQSRGASEPHE